MLKSTPIENLIQELSDLKHKLITAPDAAVKLQVVCNKVGPTQIGHYLNRYYLGMVVYICGDGIVPRLADLTELNASTNLINKTIFELVWKYFPGAVLFENTSTNEEYRFIRDRYYFSTMKNSVILARLYPNNP